MSYNDIKRVYEVINNPLDTCNVGSDFVSSIPASSIQLPQALHPNTDQ